MKKVLLKGPLLTRSGYGEQARFAFRALNSRPDLFDVYIQPLTWGNTSWIPNDDAERVLIDSLIEKTLHYVHSTEKNAGKYDISLRLQFPMNGKEGKMQIFM